MNLDLFNNLVNSVKENNIVQSFIKELSDYLEKQNNKLLNEEYNRKDNGILKQENCLYQVVDIDVDGVYLQNVENNNVSKEMDISKEILNKLGNDSVLRFKDGSYIYEEELTKQFYDSLIDVKKYKNIQDNFVKESNILEIDSNTRYKIESNEDNYCLLSYENDGKNTIEVPKELIPFWAKNGDNLYYKNGKFNRYFKQKMV